MEKEDKKEKIVRGLVLVFLGISFMYLVINYSKYHRANPTKLTTPFLMTKVTTDNDNLENTVQDVLKGASGTYAVSIKNLKNNQSYNLNEHKSFDTGSLYKLWVMAETFEQIQSGDLSEDEILSEDVSVLNSKFNIPDDQAELTDGTITLSVDDALNQMITISHNYAALLLTERIGLSSVDTFLKANGFKESKVGINYENPTTTAADIALFFEKLYKGEIINKVYSDKMLEILKKQQLNDKLPKYLPDGVIMAHKTGEIEDFSHDSGIVFDKRGDYIIVTLSETDSPEVANEKISQVSNKVYSYFLKGS